MLSAAVPAATRDPLPEVDREPPAPQWSLAGLRALVGFATCEAPDAMAALLAANGRSSRRACELVFAGVAAGLVSSRWRSALDGLLAGLLVREARALAGASLFDIAALYALRRGTLPLRARLALLWLLGRHPCRAARQLEERVAREIESDRLA